MILRNAKKEDLVAAYQCIEDARDYHKSLGFFQWPKTYPTPALLEQDADNGIGYVFEENDVICGYCTITFGDEADYQVIDGAWKTQRPYGVVHRMAFGAHCRGRGLATEAFSLIKNYCVTRGAEAIRIDTPPENMVMQHVLNRENFEYCGVVTVAGGPKLAYEWDK